MAKFEVLNTSVGKHHEDALNSVIEADVDKAEGTFFTFDQNKEVVRSVKLDWVVQIKRVDE